MAMKIRLTKNPKLVAMKIRLSENLENDKDQHNLVVELTVFQEMFHWH